VETIVFSTFRLKNNQKWKNRVNTGFLMKDAVFWDKNVKVSWVASASKN
jgi:hypothetical protein